MPNVIKFPLRGNAAAHAEPAEPTLTELARAALGCWTPPNTWYVDEAGMAFLTDAEYAEARLFFLSFGFDIEREGPLESYLSGWQYLSSEPMVFVDYKRSHRATYEALTSKWSAEDHSYISAISDNNVEQIKRLAWDTLFARGLVTKMRKPSGCALKLLRPV